jgi:general stress protein 26
MDTLRPEIRAKIEDVIARGVDMTIATQRPDGFPQATVVSYVGDGLRIYLGCGAASQKAANMTRDPKVSLTITLPYADWDHITGISAAGIAEKVTDPQEIGHLGALMLKKFPEAAKYAGMDDGTGMAVFRIGLKIVSLLDYTKGFGHSDLVEFG